MRPARSGERSTSGVFRQPVSTLPKCPSGVRGLDEITFGGLPLGRPTLVCGAAGCGKTLLGLEFLLRGASEYGDPGVLMAFDETQEDLVANVTSLGFDLQSMIDSGRIAVDHVRVERSEIEETGEYDLEGLFVRLGYAIDSIGARRVVLDTLEALFGGLTNEAILRAELRRLFRWLKDRKVTAIITGERGPGTLTRQGLEEYVSDCVILLDHRVDREISTRRLRIIKYRGSTHGTNEYPFLIDEHGISVLPITSVGLDYAVSAERVTSGVPELDEMLGGRGFFRGSSILVSGTAGTGKSSLAAHFAQATCAAGQSCLYFGFEESRNQILRNMKSIGIDLEHWQNKGLLGIETARPSLYGVEMHLANMHRLIETKSPAAVIMDPISNMVQAGSLNEAGSLVMRLADILKSRGITTLLTNLTHGGLHEEATDVGMSSLMDTWLLLRDKEVGGERSRVLYVLKSRGMAHSNQVREFLITSHGIELLDAHRRARLLHSRKGDHEKRPGAAGPNGQPSAPSSSKARGTSK